MKFRSVLLLIVSSLVPRLAPAESLLGGSTELVYNTVESNNSMENQYYCNAGLSFFTPLNEIWSFCLEGIGRAGFGILKQDWNGKLDGSADISYMQDTMVLRLKNQLFFDGSSYEQCYDIKDTLSLYFSQGDIAYSYYAMLSSYYENSKVLTEPLSDWQIKGLLGASFTLWEEFLLKMECSAEYLWMLKSNWGYGVKPVCRLDWYPALPFTISAEAFYQWNYSSLVETVIENQPPIPIDSYQQISLKTEWIWNAFPSGKLTVQIPVSYTWKQYAASWAEVFLDQKEWILNLKPDISLSLDIGKESVLTFIGKGDMLFSNSDINGFMVFSFSTAWSYKLTDEE